MPNLKNLRIICQDGSKYAHRYIQLLPVLEKFAEVFTKEAEARNWGGNLSIKLEPSSSYNKRNPELTWYNKGVVTSYFYQDFFG